MSDSPLRALIQNLPQPQVTCPHCGHVTRLKSDDFTWLTRSKLLTCDVDSGGCDGQFLYQCVPVTTYNTRAGKSLSEFEADDGKVPS